MTIYWEIALKMIFRKRDPRRLHSLVSWILSNSILDPTSHSYFSESRKVLLINILFSSFGLLTNVRLQITQHYLTNINHPYQLVRSNIGGALAILCETDWYFGIKDFSNVLSISQNENNSICIPLSYKPEITKLINATFAKISIWKVEAKSAQPGNSTDYSNAGNSCIFKLFQYCHGYIFCLQLIEEPEFSPLLRMYFLLFWNFKVMMIWRFKKKPNW